MKRLVLTAIIMTVWMIGSQPSFGYHGRREAFSQCLLRLTAEGELHLQKIVLKPVQEAHTRDVAVDVSVEENGKVVTKKETRAETYTTTRFVSELRVVKLDPEAVELFDTSGGPVKLAAVRARLRKPLLILVSADGKIHPSFAAIFKPGTLVLADPPQPLAEPIPEPVPEPVPEAPVPAPNAPQTSTQRILRRGLANPLLVRLAGQEVEKAPEPVPTLDKDFMLSPQPAPIFRYCRLDGQGAVAVRDFHEFKREVTAYREIKVGNALQKVPYSVVKTIGEDQTVFWDRNLVKFVAPDGKSLAPTQLAVLKQKEHAVVVSSDGQPVDPYWLQNVIPTAAVLLLPPVSEWATQPQLAPPPPGSEPPAPVEAVPIPAPAAPIPVPKPDPQPKAPQPKTDDAPKT